MVMKTYAMLIQYVGTRIILSHVARFPIPNKIKRKRRHRQKTANTRILCEVCNMACDVYL